MANMDRPKKMLVRTAFVTGTTVATLLGAQTLALLDQRAAIPQTNNSADIIPPSPVIAATARQQDSTTTALIHVAPSIVILREAGQVVAGGQLTSAQQPAALANTVAIQPPSPVQLSAPAPIIVQQPGGGQAPAASVQSQPAPATTQSSR